jgi:hypothetical protein
MREIEPRPKKMIDCRWWYASNRQSDFWVQNFTHVLSSKFMSLNNCFCEIVVQSIFLSEIKLKKYPILYVFLLNTHTLTLVTSYLRQIQSHFWSINSK